MKTYEVVFNEESDKGIYAVSVVENPAMESMFIALSSDKDKIPVNIQFKDSEVADKENTLIGVALIPDKEVYRNIEGDEFNIVFSKDTIKKAAHSFLKNGYQNNSSLEHEEKIEGVSIVESWVVKDPKNDTANAYELSKEDIKEGAWIVKMKCDNQEIYKKAKNGDIKGFSIDGLFSLKEINLNSNIEMSDNNSVLNAIKEWGETLLSAIKPKDDVKVELGSLNLADGKGVIEYEGDELQDGSDVFMTTEDGERVLLETGEYKLEDGSILVVEDGKVKEVKKEDAPEEEEVEMSDDSLEVLKELLANLSKDIKEMVKDKEESKKGFENLKKEFESFKAEMAKTPDTEKVKHVDKPVTLSKNASLRERIEYIKQRN